MLELNIIKRHILLLDYLFLKQFKNVSGLCEFEYMEKVLNRKIYKSIVDAKKVLRKIKLVTLKMSLTNV